MVAGVEGVITEKLGPIRDALAAVHEAAVLFHNPNQRSEMIARVSKAYDIDEDDVKAWYAGVDITAHGRVSESALERTLEVLCDVGVLDSTTSTTPASLIDDRVAKLANDIKKVKLYRSTESMVRLFNSQMAAAGKRVGSITQDDLMPFDQKGVYGGAAEMDGIVRKLNVNSDSQVRGP